MLAALPVGKRDAEMAGTEWARVLMNRWGQMGVEWFEVSPDNYAYSLPHCDPAGIREVAQEIIDEREAVAANERRVTR